jgi:hypothetical protein
MSGKIYGDNYCWLNAKASRDQKYIVGFFYTLWVINQQIIPHPNAINLEK